MMTQILILSVFALGLNLLVGYTGLFSLGHAAFFGASGYTLGILNVHYQVESFWLLTSAGLLMAVLVALLFGVIALRVSGLYFLFVTLALGELLASVAWKWRAMTGGSNGLPGIGYPDLGLPIEMNSTSYYYLSLVVFIVCFMILQRIVESPFGDALKGIRESESRMRALGYNTWLYKYIVFIIAGLFAGVSGILYAPFNLAMVPQDLGTTTSVLVMLMVLIGGDRVFWGPLVGATLVLFLQYFSTIHFPERWPMVLGGVFVFTIMFLEGGVSPHILRLWGRVTYRGVVKS
jgi:branched-chain amino acid transport system permease protein